MQYQIDILGSVNISILSSFCCFANSKLVFAISPLFVIYEPHCSTCYTNILFPNDDPQTYVDTLQTILDPNIQIFILTDKLKSTCAKTFILTQCDMFEMLVLTQFDMFEAVNIPK